MVTKYDENMLLEALRQQESGNGFEDTLEKIASVEEVLEEAGVDFSELDDEEVLEALAMADVDQEELAELLEAAIEEGYIDAEDFIEDDEDIEKEASGEELYGAGYMYGYGIASGINDGMEKVAASSDAVFNLKEQLRATKFGESAGKRAKGRAWRKGVSEELKSALGIGGRKATKKTAEAYKALPFTQRVIRRALLKGKGRAGTLSKTKLGLLGGGAAVGAGGLGYGIHRMMKKGK